MRTLKLFLVSAGMAILTNTLSAQHVISATAAQDMTNSIREHVKGITDDQAGKILIIEQDYMIGQRDARNNNHGSSRDLTDKINALRIDRESKMKDVLTKDQYSQYERAMKRQQIEGIY